MKYSLFPVAVLFLILSACGGSKSSQAYDPGCDKLVVDVNAGTINGLDGKASENKVGKQFPCATVGVGGDCGPWMGSEDKNFYFFTDQNFVEVRYPFGGQVNQRIISTGKERVTQSFGSPVRSEMQDGMEYLFFQMDYGTLVVMLQSGKARNFAMYRDDPQDVQLCR